MLRNLENSKNLQRLLFLKEWEKNGMPFLPSTYDPIKLNSVQLMLSSSSMQR